MYQKLLDLIRNIHNGFMITLVGIGFLILLLSFLSVVASVVFLFLVSSLSLRLFANMFAGHLLLLVFILGGEHLLQGVIGLKLVSPFAFAFGIGLTFFEFMVQCLQAYIFTLLTALYIAGALADEH